MRPAARRGRNDQSSRRAHECLALGLGAALSAQKPATPPNPFASARTLACSFSTFAVAGWRDGKPNTVTSTEDFSFQIAIVNLKRGRAQIIGANGAVEATLVLTPTGLNVIEQTPIGQLHAHDGVHGRRAERSVSGGARPTCR